MDRHYFWWMLLCLAGLAVLLGVALLLPMPFSGYFTSESGPIEIFTAAGYMTVVVALCREGSGAFLRRNPHLVVIPVLMCLREMDFHSHFTTQSITRLTFYLSPEISLLEKAYGVAAFAAVVWAGLMLLRNARGYLADLRRGRAYAVALLGAAFLVVFSKSIDGIGRKLAPLGIDISSEAGKVFGVAEEVLELGIPLLFLIAVFAYFPPRRTGGMPRP